MSANLIDINKLKAELEDTFDVDAVTIKNETELNVTIATIVINIKINGQQINFYNRLHRVKVRLDDADFYIKPNFPALIYKVITHEIMNMTYSTNQQTPKYMSLIPDGYIKDTQQYNADELILQLLGNLKYELTTDAVYLFKHDIIYNIKTEKVDLMGVTIAIDFNKSLDRILGFFNYFEDSDSDEEE